MIEATFKYGKGQLISYKEEEMIIIGRSEFLDQPNRYMLQNAENFKKNGLDFTKGIWVSEKDKKIITIKN